MLIIIIVLYCYLIFIANVPIRKVTILLIRIIIEYFHSRTQVLESVFRFSISVEIGCILINWYGIVLCMLFFKRFNKNKHFLLRENITIKQNHRLATFVFILVYRFFSFAVNCGYY